MVDHLIHSADPQSRPVVIIVFIVRTYVRPHFSNIAKQIEFQTKTIGETVDLAEWIFE